MAALMTWLVPADGPGRDEIAAVIGGLAAEHGAPRFQPHVTVVAGFSAGEREAAAALRSLAGGVPAFEITFGGFGQEQAYFRSLYLRAEPSAALTALHEAARRAWAVPAARYLPHLSLLYADIAAERKPAIIDGIGIRLPLTALFDAVELWAGADADAGVGGWRRLGRVPLGRRLPPAGTHAYRPRSCRLTATAVPWPGTPRSFGMKDSTAGQRSSGLPSGRALPPVPAADAPKNR